MTGTMTAVGLMSGTSMDGIDAALIETDGHRIVRHGGFVSVPYEASLRADLARTIGGRTATPDLVSRLTQAHAVIVEKLLSESAVDRSDINVIGFHGHTIFHKPEDGVTIQIGDGAALARATGIDVVNDMRSADVAGGGQGAPLAPLYHAALAAELQRPLAVLNIGGIANVTWIGTDGDLLAFDTGPGNGLLDDWMRRHDLGEMDRDGALARSGTVRDDVLSAAMRHPYFAMSPPKSLDRLDFTLDVVDGLSPADGAATLAAFTARAVADGVRFLPEAPRRWIVCGGGRHNPAIMARLRQELSGSVESVEAVGWRGDAIEAEAFAFLAVRSLLGLPLSLPGSTGVRAPMPGGVLHRASEA